MGTHLITANDNMPLGYNSPAGTTPASRREGGPSEPVGGLISVSKYSPVKRGVRIQNTFVPPSVTPSSARKHVRRKTGQKTNKSPVYALLLLWGIMVAGITRFSGGLPDNVLSGANLAYAAGGLGLLSLLLASTARRRSAKISHSIGIASACVCACGIIWYYWQLSGAKISVELLVLGLAATSLIFAKLWRTPFLLHMSLLVMLGWSSYSFLNTSVSELAWLFPALWSVQMLLALEFRFKRTIVLSIVTGLLWIGVNLFLLA